LTAEFFLYDPSDAEAFICEAFMRYPSLTNAAQSIMHELFPYIDISLISYKTCIDEIVNNLEKYGLEKAMEDKEPYYHNRQHTKEVLISVFLFFNQEKEYQSKFLYKDIALWPPFTPHQKLLLIIAALGHDYFHPGGRNQKTLEFELQASLLIRKIMQYHHLPLSDIDIVSELILATEYHKVKEVHNAIKYWNSEEQLPFILRAKALLTEADICASILPNYGRKLTQKLAREWELLNIKSDDLLTTKGRKDFLNQIKLTSPYVRSLGLNAIFEMQLDYLDKELT
jgi:hypothetical protein